MATRGDSQGGSHAPTLAHLNSWVSSLAIRVRARVLFVILDAFAVCAGYGLAEIAFLRDHPPTQYWQHLLRFLLVAVTFQLVINNLFGLYGRMWRHAGIEEARQVVLSGAAGAAVLILLHPIGHLGKFDIPYAVIGVGATLVTVAMGGLRFHSRLFARQRIHQDAGLRVAVIGSHDAGATAIREMVRSPGAGLLPVAVFDDDRRTHGFSIMGVPVVGGIDDLAREASRYTVQQVLLAIPHAPSSVVERALAACEAAGVTLKVLPSVRDLVAGTEHTLSPTKARDPGIEDLIGRSELSTDLGAVRQLLAGKRVLITGAGGSIGSEISRQVSEFAPAELLLLDHDETHLYDTAASVTGSSMQVLVDVTDRPALFEVFMRHRPEVVFHAAAHKHVPILEEHPVEAARVNVLGTVNVTDAATAVSVERFVLISTDKAVRPTTVMGASKCLAEQVALVQEGHVGTFCAVRFGNVLGSRGSVVPTFTRQIGAGGPVTVTDKRMTRYFMSVEEAVQLVLQASVLAEGGEVFVLDMGQPVRIIDLAERMIKLSGLRVGSDIAIKIVGRRAGEKLHEELWAPEEKVFETPHSFIRRVLPVAHPEISSRLSALREAAVRRDAELVRDMLLAGAGVEAKPRRGVRAPAALAPPSPDHDVEPAASQAG